VWRIIKRGWGLFSRFVRIMWEIGLRSDFGIMCGEVNKP
jgi:hypothetical protein